MSHVHPKKRHCRHINLRIRNHYVMSQKSHVTVSNSRVKWKGEYNIYRVEQPISPVGRGGGGGAIIPTVQRAPGNSEFIYPIMKTNKLFDEISILIAL